MDPWQMRCEINGEIKAKAKKAKHRIYSNIYPGWTKLKNGQR